MITFRGGKKPAQPARPHLKITAVINEAQQLGLLAPPPDKSLYADDAITWDMLGNDQYGDCVEAGYAHLVNQVTFYGSGTEFKPTTSDTLGMYSAITGFKPTDPSTDDGTYTQDALAYARKTGLDGHKIVAYAAIDVANQIEVKQALSLFGQLLVGIQFPASAMDQFNAGQDWDVVKGAKIEGGHCVLIVGYDSAGLDVITWGKRIRMTWAFWKKYTDEAWLALDQEGVKKVGSYFTGLASLYALGQAFTALTNEPNPIPQPAPQPTPTPAPPAPVPAVDADTLTAYRALEKWAKANGVSA